MKYSRKYFIKNNVNILKFFKFFIILLILFQANNITEIKAKLLCNNILHGSPKINYSYVDLITEPSTEPIELCFNNYAVSDFSIFILKFLS